MKNVLDRRITHTDLGNFFYQILVSFEAKENEVSGQCYIPTRNQFIAKNTILPRYRNLFLKY